MELLHSLRIHITPTEGYFVSVYIDGVFIDSVNEETHLDLEYCEGKHKILAINSRYKDHRKASSVAKFDRPHIKKPDLNEIILASAEFDLKLYDDTIIEIAVVKDEKMQKTDENCFFATYLVNMRVNGAVCLKLRRNSGVLEKKQKKYFIGHWLVRSFVLYDVISVAAVVAAFLLFFLSGSEKQLRIGLTGYQVAAFIGVIGLIIIVVMVVLKIQEKCRLSAMLDNVFP